MILHCKNGIIIDSSYVEVNVNILYTSTGKPMQSKFTLHLSTAEGQANLDMLKEFLEMDGSNGDLNGI